MIQNNARFLGLYIPKKFESKASFREFVTSKEFVGSVKLKIAISWDNMLNK